MPKTVLRSGATSAAPAATQAAAPTSAPATASAAQTAPVTQLSYEQFEANLRGMNLPEAAIKASLDAYPVRPAVKAEAPVVPEAKPVEKAPDAKAEVVEPAEDPTAGMSDAEYAVYMAEQQEKAAPPTNTAGAAPAPKETHAAAEEVDDRDDEAAHGTAGTVTVQNHWSQASKGALSGDINRNDFKTPQLKLIQGLGENAAKYGGQGKLIFQEQRIFDTPTSSQPSPAMRFIPVTLRKYYREVLEKGSKATPRQANTAEEVQALGGTIDWTVGKDGKRQKPSWSPAAQVLLLIEKPKDVQHEGFTFNIEINGEPSSWAPAVFYVNGGSYRSMAKSIIDATNFLLREGDSIVLHKRIWKMNIVTEKSGENWVYLPKVAIANDPVPADLRAFAESFLSK